MTANSIYTAPQADPVLPKGWAPSSDSFTSNEVIDAYFTGKQDGKQEAYEKTIQQYKTKIRTATAVVEELTALANENGYPLHAAFLRYLGQNAFEAVYLVPENIYLSEEMKAVMRLARDFKKKYRSDDFMITFLFMAYTDNPDIDALIADGYTLKTI